jgi:hypothetical protein
MVKVHAALLVVCAVAVLACVGLSVPLLTRSAPEACCSAEVAGTLPSPTSSAPATRLAGLPSCLIGSWRVVEQQESIKFYIDDEPLAFTFGGGDRYYEFHPDGQAVERNTDFTMVGSHRGQKVRTVRNGERTFTWSATATRITYHSVASTTLVVDYYDQRGKLSPATEMPSPTLNETDDISCSPTQVIESTDDYRATWQRTADYGVYG